MKTTVDDLNDICRAAVNDVHGERPPSHMTDDERDEWRETSDRLFMVGCYALTPDMDAATARDRALAAVREAAARA